MYSLTFLKSLCYVCIQKIGSLTVLLYVAGLFKNVPALV